MTGAHPRRICLALQGGGSHGAFEWGALDALLEDGRLSPAAASGASAGAMNAVVMADGLSKGATSTTARVNKTDSDPTSKGATSTTARVNKTDSDPTANPN